MGSYGIPLGIEIHTLFYYYYDNDPALKMLLCLCIKILSNRSDTSYHDVYLGIFNDFDLGKSTKMIISVLTWKIRMSMFIMETLLTIHITIWSRIWG